MILLRQNFSGMTNFEENQNEAFTMVSRFNTGGFFMRLFERKHKHQTFQQLEHNIGSEIQALPRHSRRAFI